MDFSDQIQIRIFETHHLSAFLGKDPKKVFLRSGFRCKNGVQQLPYVSEDDSINYIPGNFASGDDKVQNFAYGDLSEGEW